MTKVWMLIGLVVCSRSSYTSVLGFLGLFSQYDVVIVDYDLGELNGKDVADYMATIFKNKSMVMISIVDRSMEMLNCPSCVKAFMKKSAGYEKILNTALKVSLSRNTNLG